MPESTRGQQLLYAVALGTWGTMCEYINCVRQRDNPSYAPQLCPTTTTTALATTTTPATTTTTLPTGVKCANIDDLIKKDASTNSTLLTTALNEAYATWSRTDKANFVAYKKRIEIILWNNTLTVRTHESFEYAFFSTNTFVCVLHLSWQPASTQI